MEEKQDVITIGSKQTGGETEEQKKQKMEEAIRKEAELLVKNTFRTPFRQIYEEVKKGKTLSQIGKEIEEKKSNLPKGARDLFLNFKESKLQDWVDTYEEDEAFFKFRKRIKYIKNRN